MNKKDTDIVKYDNGMLFNDFERNRTFSNALSDVIAIGIDIIAERTPVDTGLLRNSWDSTENAIFNDVSYFKYVEYGTRKMEGRFMMTRSIPEITELFQTRVLKSFDD
jgi:hypothetical protein